VTIRARAFFVVVAMMSAAAARAQLAVTGDLSATADADHFDSARLRSGVLTDYESSFHYAGFAAQTTHYTASVSLRCLRHKPRSPIVSVEHRDRCHSAARVLFCTVRCCGGG